MTRAAPKNNALNIALWVIQVLLFAAFFLSGFMKLTTPLAQLSGTMAWTAIVPEGLIRFIGLAEIAGALGLLLPALTRIQPALVQLAALGLTVVMVLAVGFHLTQGFASSVAPSIVLGFLAAFVAWGRNKIPILARA